MTNEYVIEETYYDNYDIGYVIAAFLGVFVFFLFLTLITYVISSILLMGVYKRAGHKTPASAWVPIWRTATLLQVGGIQKAWIWILAVYGGIFVTGLIPYIGSIIVLAIYVIFYIAIFYVYRNTQRSFGLAGSGNLPAVLGVFFPLFYYIWLYIVTKGRNYDLSMLRQESEKFPMNWFGNEDPTMHFSLNVPPAPTYANPSAPVYTPPAPVGTPFAPPTGNPVNVAPQPEVEPEAPTSEGSPAIDTPQKDEDNK